MDQNGRVTQVAQITYIEHDESTYTVDVESGTSLMRGAVDNDIDGIVAECGGNCCCATCHCYIDAAWVDKLPAPESDERDLLACVRDPAPNSRLSCQITVTDALDGLVVRLPKSQC